MDSVRRLAKVHPDHVKRCTLSYTIHRVIHRWTYRVRTAEKEPMSKFTIDRHRFKDLLLYGSSRLADDPTFGETKLNKFLFYCDFVAYRRLGTPITGAEYQKNLYGPTARLYPVLRDELRAGGQLDIEVRVVGGRDQGVVIPLVLPDMPTRFRSDEIEIIDGVAEDLRGRTNKQVSDESHEREAGWRAKEFGETIPYSSALINLEPLSEKALDALRKLVAA